MQGNILVAYASWTGATQSVAEFVAKEIGGDALPAKKIKTLHAYQSVVVGGAVRMGRPHPDFAAFLKRHRKRLSETPFAWFLVCLTMRDDSEASRSEVNGYLDKLRADYLELKPLETGLFPGWLRYQKLPPPLRFMVKRMETPEGDFRDWQRVGEWTAGLKPKLTAE